MIHAGYLIRDPCERVVESHSSSGSGGQRTTGYVRGVVCIGSPGCYIPLPKVYSVPHEWGPYSLHYLSNAVWSGRHWKSLYPPLISVIVNEASFSLSHAGLVWDTTKSQIGSSLENI